MPWRRISWRRQIRWRLHVWRISLAEAIRNPRKLAPVALAYFSVLCALAVQGWLMLGPGGAVDRSAEKWPCRIETVAHYSDGRTHTFCDRVPPETVVSGGPHHDDDRTEVVLGWVAIGASVMGSLLVFLYVSTGPEEGWYLVRNAVGWLLVSGGVFGVGFALV